ncbi:Lrp/AsnC family transcriptional regulator [Amycolatopsis methanolica]|uniref:AsnC family transcriptional regulator n=1 Tax=Amycolatopsis methanolica 239 TaxID=1068978 RepID=A0A076N073_AMYME|nr:Lrp/AsnC family transcriptional regulator [Amycolatopsis methanolica]AIJ23217.1 AsnC family transcriptional regulator [Amycolatopsis methanolica 239]
MLDETDRRILARLAVNGRETWANLARALGLSESKVARRAQRLFDSGCARVVAVPDPLRCGFGTPVLVHLKCVPGHARAVAECLAARPDTRLVVLLAGNFDVLAELISTDRDHLMRVIHEDFRELQGALEVSVESVLRTFKVGFDWARELLGHDAVTPRSAPPAAHRGACPELSAVDLDLIAALSTDGRLSYATLAQRLGITESLATRRLRHLVGCGYLTFSPLIDPALLGYEIEAFLRMRVDLRKIGAIARRLCRETSVRYVSATTGASDLVCEAVLRDHAALYEFVTGTIAGLEGVRSVETTVELGSVKRAYRPRPVRTHADDAPRKGEE